MDLQSSVTHIEGIKNSIKANPRQPHYAFVNELKNFMRITKKTITLKDNIYVCLFNDQLCIPIYDKYQKIWRLKYLPKEFINIIDQINMDLNTQEYNDFLHKNNYTFNPQTFTLTIFEL